MIDLSHWDFADVFSGHEAASLILGVEPAEAPLHKIEPILKRMERSYKPCSLT
jgi:hypothetical protein